jgi:twinkle protein
VIRKNNIFWSYKMANVIERVQCPNCKDTGQDNLIKYSDGGSFCFACNQSGGSSELNLDFSYRDINSRGITRKTCEKYEYHIGNYKGHTCHFATIKEGKRVIGYKIRRHDSKQFFTIGQVPRETLIGKHLFSTNPNGFVVITEGELDMLSVYQVLGTKSVVVSLAHGVSSAEKTIANNLNWLNKFKYVVLCFDNDKQGVEATNKVVKLFDRDKVRVCKLTEKDANDMVTKGKSKELYQSLRNAMVRFNVGYGSNLSD